MPILTRFTPASATTSTDVRMVLAASEALQIREINLFRLAYAQWFGHAPTEPAIERPFMRYLFTEQAPVWVRHFARDVVVRWERGSLDPTAYGLAHRAVPPLGGGAFDAWARAVHLVGWLVMVGVLAVGLF